MPLEPFNQVSLARLPEEHQAALKAEQHTMAVATGLANQMGIFEGTTVALMQQTIQYKGAVKFGETVHLVMTVKERKDTKNPSRGVVTFDVPVLNRAGDVVVQSEWVLMMARRPQAAV